MLSSRRGMDPLSLMRRILMRRTSEICNRPARAVCAVSACAGSIAAVAVKPGRVLKKSRLRIPTRSMMVAVGQVRSVQVPARWCLLEALIREFQAAGRQRPRCGQHLWIFDGDFVRERVPAACQAFGDVQGGRV